ncbi:unnamed protein product [Gordionus sp. m RMFG-2023]
MGDKFIYDIQLSVINSIRKNLRNLKEFIVRKNEDPDENDIGFLNVQLEDVNFPLDTDFIDPKSPILAHLGEDIFSHRIG